MGRGWGVGVEVYPLANEVRMPTITMQTRRAVSFIPCLHDSRGC